MPLHSLFPTAAVGQSWSGEDLILSLGGWKQEIALANFCLFNEKVFNDRGGESRVRQVQVTADVELVLPPSCAWSYREQDHGLGTVSAVVLWALLLQPRDFPLLLSAG